MDSSIFMIEWIEAELAMSGKQSAGVEFADGDRNRFKRHREKDEDRRGRRDYLLNAYEELLSTH
ncbi:hypothetical protein DTW90_32085 [Neorhizobium sp. P12A]|uniref:hypothetical protein n=1 Tax=Neorhizobium sp. P12A TaxID=2268027 RepID=UPI0011EC9D71|nr:hypothetical protein [Neorhizobium sp. P12A]KAA0689145.1 hypothetical protein DTW90_32085 [Neorhizobium sp. P12A]